MLCRRLVCSSSTPSLCRICSFLSSDFGKPILVYIYCIQDRPLDLSIALSNLPSRVFGKYLGTKHIFGPLVHLEFGQGFSALDQRGAGLILSSALSRYDILSHYSETLNVERVGSTRAGELVKDIKPWPCPTISGSSGTVEQTRFSSLSSSFPFYSSLIFSS